RLDPHPRQDLMADQPPADDRPTRPRARRRLLLAAAALAVLFTGCASVPSNTPDAYGEVTEDNYLSACEASGASSADCQCLYDAIVETVPFEDFEDFEDRVAEDPTDVPGPYRDIVDDCGARPAGDGGD